MLKTIQHQQKRAPQPPYQDLLPPLYPMYHLAPSPCQDLLPSLPKNVLDPPLHFCCCTVPFNLNVMVMWSLPKIRIRSFFTRPHVVPKLEECQEMTKTILAGRRNTLRPVPVKLGRITEMEIRQRHKESET